MASDTPQAPDSLMTESDESSQKLDLQVQVESRGPCERHVTVEIPREDIDRYYAQAFDEVMLSAQIPGFRAGKAPRQLIERRYKREVADQVKSSLLVDSLTQVSESENLAPISEPDLDLETIEIGEEGPLTFEFDIEVRPEFDLPEWKELAIEKPNQEFSEEDVDARLKELLKDRGTLVPQDRAAESGDHIVTNITVKDGEEVLSKEEEVTLHLLPTLRFEDGDLEGFDTLIAGARAEESRTGKMKLSDEVEDEAMQGKEVEVTFEVLEVKQLELPELTGDFLKELGDFETEADLRDRVRGMMQEQLEYQQRQGIREQITSKLVEAADWELPKAMLRRQASRELERSILELQRSGFSDQEIRAHESRLRQQSLSSTERALKEHFVLERIAEEESIDASPEDFEMEILMIAMRSGQNPRRVRSQLEKRNQMDVLRNQIIERKVVDLIREHANVTDVPYQEVSQVETVNFPAGGVSKAAPSAEDVPTEA
ncbi:Trigger factor [Planctomycetales bacterium 10988]|nr:Trigger factor [Planctomycetales bacterium 10988]